MRIARLCFFFALVGNIWLWKIVFLNPIIALLIFITTISFYFWLQYKRKSFGLVFGALFFILLFIQWQTTRVPSLTNRDNDEQRVQQMRLKEYPPTRISVGDKTKWIPLGFWLEGRNEVLVYQRVLNNFFDHVDPNLYFFANHPRERGADEFEKFPYVLLPFFFYGIFVLLKAKSSRLKLAIFILPLLLIAIIGNQNRFGPFALFPLFVTSIATGLTRVTTSILAMSKRKSITIFIGLAILFVLVFVQAIIYELA